VTVEGLAGALPEREKETIKGVKMFRRRGKTAAFTDALDGITPLAEEVAQDEKLRRRLGTALAHGLAATREARLRGRARQLAANGAMLAHLGEMVSQLEAAKQRRNRKRRNRKLMRSLVLAVPVAAVAVPQSRSWLKERLGGAKQATGKFGGVVSAPAVGGRMRIEEEITLDVPVGTAYNQWTQFEEFPQFMEGVEEVRQLDDKTLHWVASVGGNRAEWDARIIEQVPDQRIVWESIEGKQTRGSVEFTPQGASRSTMRITMEYAPEGVMQKIGSAAGLDARRVRGDLDRFKQLIESRGTEDGAWRGEIQRGEIKEETKTEAKTKVNTKAEAKTKV
jgi:uncharacterized membrane protein